MLAVVILSLALAVVDRQDADRLYEHGQFRQAADQYRKLLDANPADTSLSIRFGDCALQLGLFQDAETAFERVLHAAPDSLAALVGKTEALLGEGKSTDARQPISSAMRLAPGDRDVRRAFAHVLEANNQFFPAERILKELTGADPQDAQSWFLLGELSYRGGYYQAAQESLATSLAIQPANRRAQIYSAVCLIKTGRLDEGEAQSKRLIQDPSTPKDLDLWLTYVELLYDSNRTNDALQTANQVVAFASDSPIARYWLAKTLLQAGNLAEASREAEQAVATAPQLPFARVLLLQVYRRQGRSADAERQAAWLRDYDDRRARHEPR